MSVNTLFSNQIIIAASLESLQPHILRYWQMQKNDKEILGLLLSKHMNTENYGLG
jgi:hypothetical protein